MIIDREYTKIILAIIEMAKSAQSEYAGSDTGLQFVDVFLRVVGLLKDKDLTVGENLVDQILKSQNINNKELKKLMLEYLESLRTRLDKWQDSKINTKIKRLEKLLSTSVDVQIEDQRNIKDNIDYVREKLIELKFEQDQTGALYKELSILQLLTSRTDTVIDSIDFESIGEFGGALASILRVETINVERRVKYLQRRSRALSIELVKLQEREKMISTGFDTLMGGQVSLIKTIEFLIYLMKELQYTCKECYFFKQGKCKYAGSETATIANNSCNETWSLVENDYWTANEAIVDKARQKLE